MGETQTFRPQHTLRHDLSYFFSSDTKKVTFFFFLEHASAIYLLLSEKLAENRKQKTLALTLSPNVKIEIFH